MNTAHKLADDQAVHLPMRRKLARHLANNACENAMKKLHLLKHDISEGNFDIGKALEKIEQEEKAEKERNASQTGVNRMKTKL